MNDFARDGMHPGAQGFQIRIDKDTPKIKCGACGNEVFQQVFMVVKISAIESPTGKDLYVEDGHLQCLGCGRARKLQQIEEKE